MLFTRYYFNAKKTPSQLSASQAQSLSLKHSSQEFHKLDKKQAAEIKNSQEPLKAPLQPDSQQDNIPTSSHENSEPQMDNKKVDKETQTAVSLSSSTKDATLIEKPLDTPTVTIQQDNQRDHPLTSLQSPISDNQQSIIERNFLHLPSV